MKINRKVVIRVNGYIYKEIRGNTEMVGIRKINRKLLLDKKSN